MTEHPIQGLMKTAMESIKEMVDVNTVIGDAVEAPDGSVIIPVSRVGLGFAAGGSEFGVPKETDLPFGGGSGAGVSVQPVGFLVVGQGAVRLLPVSQGAIFDRLVDLVPQLVDKMQDTFGNGNGDHDSRQNLLNRQQQLERQVAELQNQIKQRTIPPL
ncbi:MAG: GerW family sporulation protein [Eubacteriales bacterium]|nr:GerW family sporulation protein [Eubacteriales bacterium]MDD3074188.1 GerW family sporulation protein [Eubacteriales bacterium]MDD4079309.1 GerW family sporulation protein [Eubacteriales bacterium]MDD4768601.1 GerW family sporulation protein [Eubacteriales bacterium]